jgi:signal transduction histidine kinase
MEIKKVIWFLIIITFLSICPLSIKFLSEYRDNIDNYQVEISGLARTSGLTGIDNLPYARNVFFEQTNFAPIEWTLTARRLNPSPEPSIWIPHFIGRLVVTRSGIVLYDSRDIKELVSRSRGQGVIIPITTDFYWGGIELIVQIYPFNGNLAALSKIYIGDRADFEKVAIRQYFFNTTLLNAIVIIELLFLFFILCLMYKGLYRSIGTGFVLVILFFILGQINRLLFNGNELSLITPYILSLSPFFAFGLLIIYKHVACKGSKPLSRKYFLISLTFCTFPLLSLLLGLSSIKSSVMLFSLPLILSTLLLFFILSLYKYTKTFKLNTAMLAIVLWFSLLSVSFEFGHAVGFIKTPMYMSQFASVAIIFYIGVNFISEAVRAQRFILRDNNNLKIALQKQAILLNDNYTDFATLLQKNAIEKTRQDLYRDLHDGVLTHLSVINSISETSNVPDMKLIQQKNRLAINDIRVSLALEANSNDNLLIALSVLRKDTIVPLENFGVKISWNTSELLGCEFKDTFSVINVIRILQEAIHNAYFRAECKELEVTCIRNHTNGFICINILNSGGKTYLSKAVSGRGLENMASRARKIGGSISISPLPGGAVFVLKFPMSL